MGLHLPLAWLVLAWPFADSSTGQSAATRALGWAERCAQRFERARDQVPALRSGQVKIVGTRQTSVVFSAQMGDRVFRAEVDNSVRLVKDHDWSLILEFSAVPSVNTRSRAHRGRTASIQAPIGDPTTISALVDAFRPAADACLEEADQVKARSFMWEGRLKSVEPIGRRAVTAFQVDADPRYLLTFQVTRTRNGEGHPFSAKTTQVFAVHSPSRLCDQQVIDGKYSFWMTGEVENGRTTWHMERYTKDR